MTASHHRILGALCAEPQRWFHPYELAENNVGAGAIARLLRTLCSLGLAEQRQFGWFNRRRGIKLWGYRVSEEGRRAFRQDWRIEDEEDKKQAAVTH